ncbi:DNA polymerase [Actinoplanes sp. NPDC089786]|uniref:DNA polymerase n=1 Tax=Actinoplanes sp. NPDC089786 TaxID=3155185 RepID=UPI003449AC15
MSTVYTRQVCGRPVQVVADPGPEEFARFARSETLFGLDVETTPIDDAGPRFFGPGFGVRLVQIAAADQAMVLRATDPQQRQMIELLLGDPECRFVTHTNFDVIAVWAAFGIALGLRAIDTHVLACLLEPGVTADHGLKSLSERHLDDGLRRAEDDLYALFRALAPAGQRAGGRPAVHGWSHVPIGAEPYVVYAGLDAIYVRRLLDVLLGELADLGYLPAAELWLAAQTTALQIRGILLDLDHTNTLRAEFEQANHTARADLEALMGCKATSPKRLDWLAERGVEFRHFTDADRPSLSGKDALPDLLARYPGGEVGRMLELTTRMAETGNFATNLARFPDFADANGRVHPDYRTLAAHTGRMSVKWPAMQTFKKDDPRLRGCFVAEPGHVLVGCDFKAVEVRVAAALANEPRLIEVIRAGTDIHDNTARLMFGPGWTKAQRTLGKRATFGTIYGGGAPGLAKQTGVSVEVARDVVQRFKRAYPRITAFGKAMAERDPVRNAARRRIPADPARTYANSNYAIQSTARDLLVESLYRLCALDGWHPFLWAIIHDEIVLQVPAGDAEDAKRALEQAMTTSFRGVPIEADAEIIGSRWGGHDADVIPFPASTPLAAAA